MVIFFPAAVKELNLSSSMTLMCQLSVQAKWLLRSHRKDPMVCWTVEKTPFCERCDCFILWLLHVSCTYLFVCLETIAWGCSSLGVVMKEQHGLDKLYLTRLFRWRWIVFVLFPGAKPEELVKCCNVTKWSSTFIVTPQILLTPVCMRWMGALQAYLLIDQQSVQTIDTV